MAKHLTGKIAPSPVGSKTDAVRRLEALRPRLDALAAERIRADSEIERLEGEAERARAAARDAFGTDDPPAIAAMIEAEQARGEAAIADLEGVLATIEARLSAASAGE